ncbi:ABC transporter (plasmid) [Clostridiaceae bacterium 14S0207]|nr:ABC transporter [Clostridiaceae bacterium 14S0207]
MKENNSSTNRNIRYLLKEAINKDKMFIILLLSSTAINTIIPCVSVFIPKFIIDYIGHENKFNDISFKLIELFLIFCILKFVSCFLQGVISKRIMKIRIQFVINLQKRCLDMDYPFTENPDILNENLNAWKACQGGQIGIESVYNTIFNVSNNIVVTILFLYLIFNLSIGMFMIIFISFIVSYTYHFRAKKFQHDNITNISKLDRKNDYIGDLMSNFAYGKEMRIYNLKEFMANKFNKLVNDRVKVEKKIKTKFMNSNIIDSIFIFIKDGVGLVYLTYSVLNNKMSIGEFTMYFSILSYINIMSGSIIEDFAHIRAQNLYINDYIDFMKKYDCREVTTEGYDIPIIDKLEFEFKNVSFKYPFTDRYIYEDLNLKICAGEKLAVVGVNGSGKTTLIKLLTRLYEPTSGEILLNGINIKKFNKKEYFKIFSVVFQDSKLYPFTIKENISSQEEGNEKKVLDSLEKADMIEKINKLHKGIDTSVFKHIDEQGIEFSGGENQKLTLARALYKDGNMIILDEPTAALDPIAENELYNNFNNLINGKTAIYISHRLASTSFCDKIALFENGKIIEYGNHSELMAQKGQYYKIFKTQASYYKTDEKEVQEYEYI